MKADLRIVEQSLSFLPEIFTIQWTIWFKINFNVFTEGVTSVVKSEWVP